MPMIVDPSAPQVTRPTRVTSPDGWLAAVVDPLWAGVTLSYNGDTPPGARNLVLNPSAEVGLSDTNSWATITRNRVTSEHYIGAASIEHVAVSTSAAGTRWTTVPITGGQTVTFGVWVKLSTGVTWSSGLLGWRFGANTSLKTTAITPPTPGVWTRVTGSYTLAAGETCDNVSISFVPSAVGAKWYADAAMAETGAVLHDYVDGSLPGGVWEGAPHASPSIRATAVPDVEKVLQVRIVRTDPDAAAPVPVRSGDPAWAVEGVGTAYDHEAPLGVPVIYTATAIYLDGTTGPSSSLSVTVPAPEPGADRDLWIKSLDEPGLSARVMVVDWQSPASAARLDATNIAGSPYRAVAFDEHGAEAVQVVVDVPPEDVDQMRALLRSGVLLAQVRPGYLTPDAFHVPADISGPTPTGKLGSSEGYRFGWTIEPIGRPATAEQPLMLPGWSYDELADRFATYDAVAASYSSYASLSTNGAI